MPRPSRNTSRMAEGFSLIEAAVAIAIIAILASAAAPLVLKALNQQREQRARSEMKLIYSALFGSADPSSPCMRTDFGYAGALNTLGWLVRRPARVRAYAAYAPPYDMLSGGWRGPYWSGNVSAAGQPTDPWGRPYIIRNAPAQGWQILCLGSNGVNNTNNSAAILGDDLAYPVPAVGFSNGTLSVNVNAVPPALPPTATVVALVPDYLAVRSISPSTSVAQLYTFTSTIPPGQVLVKVTVPSKPDQYQSLYMPPGSTQTLTFYF